MHSIQTTSSGPLKPFTYNKNRFEDPSLFAKSEVEQAEEVQDAFTKFIGNAFFGMMLKSLRTSVGKPAYFHGGQAEEIFRSQLDQTLSDEMTSASADQIADPMFERSFPMHAKVLQDAKKSNTVEQNKNTTLQDLAALRRF